MRFAVSICVIFFQPMSEVITRLVENGCPDISGNLDVARCDLSPFENGGFGTVYRGSLLDGTSVALKCINIKVYADGEDEDEQKVLKVRLLFV